MSTLLYESIKNYLLEIIKKNDSNSNYILPSENSLAAKLNVSRVSVRKALSELEAEGLVYKVKGKGTFIKSTANIINSESKLETASDIIAFICPNFSTNFPRRISKGIKAHCKEIGINVIFLCAFTGSSEEEQAISFAKSLGCRGMIIMPSDEDNYNNGILALALNKFPTILIDRVLFGLNLSCVGSDHRNIGVKATEYLLKNHKEPCLITLTDAVSSVRERIAGYKDALAAAKIKTRHHLMLQSYTDDQVLNIMMDYFEKNPSITGIICNSGHIFSLTVKAMAMLNRTLNKDYEIVTIDDDSNGLNIVMDKKIPAIKQDSFNIGYTSAKMLCDSIYNNTPTQNTKVPLAEDLSSYVSPFEKN